MLTLLLLEHVAHQRAVWIRFERARLGVDSLFDLPVHIRVVANDAIAGSVLIAFSNAITKA